MVGFGVSGLDGRLGDDVGFGVSGLDGGLGDDDSIVRDFLRLTSNSLSDEAWM